MVKPDTNQYKRNMVNFNPTTFTTDLATNFAKTNYETQNANELGKNIIDTFKNRFPCSYEKDVKKKKLKTIKNHAY